MEILPGGLQTNKDLLVLFKNNIPEDSTVAATLSSENVETFFKEQIFDEGFNMNVNAVMTNENISKIAIVTERNYIRGFAAFVSVPDGHYCILLGVHNVSRSRGFGK